MSRLYLLRHARASWPTPGMRDFDRLLDDGAADDAMKIGKAMRERALVPERIICSPARRTRQTWESLSISIGLEYDAAEFNDQIYSGDSDTYLTQIRSHGDIESLLVIGHNPTLEELALNLPVNIQSRAARHIENGFTPCALAVIDFETGFAAIGYGNGHFHDFITPEDI